MQNLFSYHIHVHTEFECVTGIHYVERKLPLFTSYPISLHTTFLIQPHIPTNTGKWAATVFQHSGKSVSFNFRSKGFIFSANFTYNKQQSSQDLDSRESSTIPRFINSMASAHIVDAALWPSYKESQLVSKIKIKPTLSQSNQYCLAPLHRRIKTT